MPDRPDPKIHEPSGSQQRYFKLTSKARAPEVTREWPAEEIPWYYYYILDIVLILISIPLVFYRTKVPDDSLLAILLELGLIVIFIHVIIPQRGQ